LKGNDFTQRLSSSISMIVDRPALRADSSLFRIASNIRVRLTPTTWGAFSIATAIGVNGTDVSWICIELAYGSVGIEPNRAIRNGIGD
jgi:hypothetical protein